MPTDGDRLCTVGNKGEVEFFSRDGTGLSLITGVDACEVSVALPDEFESESEAETLGFTASGTEPSRFRILVIRSRVAWLTPLPVMVSDRRKMPEIIDKRIARIPRMQTELAGAKGRA